ncbi:Hsp20/alpha crystallin family protein [Bacillus sp. Marseille-P3661]|uniref:Hsp20/alpha crystallin family protein n=1 Tax=Bacillus sp. Marseille-P3661 TaxID=1936234 RepID=UPI000C84D07A|nr:Hsp20/alpha crystallin family protein [Bacillus sp. Marseille-P3661]
MDQNRNPKRNLINQQNFKQFIKSTERFLDDTFGHFNFSQLNFNNFDLKNMFHRTMPIKINETTTHYIVVASLPGYAKEDIKVELINQQLKITAMTSKDPSSHIERILGFPHPIQEESIQAKMKNGLLKVFIKKQQPTGRSIAIESN